MKHIVYIIYLFTFLFSQSTQDFLLKDVKVEGNVVSSANTIIFTSGLRKGITVSTAEFPRAIKRLWQLGLFDDVQIRYDDENNNESDDWADDNTSYWWREEQKSGGEVRILERRKRREVESNDGSNRKEERKHLESLITRIRALRMRAESIGRQVA